MRNARQIAASIAQWAAAFAKATADRCRSIANAARAFRASVLRMYAAFERALCEATVGGLEVVLAFRQVLYVLAIPFLIAAAAVYFARWWIWIFAVIAWALVAGGIIGARERIKTQSDAGVLSERVRDLLARGLKFTIRSLVVVVSAVLTLRVVVPLLTDEFNELRRRAAQRAGASPESRPPSTPRSSTDTPERRAALPTHILLPDSRAALEATPEKIPAAEPESVPASPPASSDAQHTSAGPVAVPTAPRLAAEPAATAADVARLNLPSTPKPHLDGVAIRIVWSPSRVLEARRLESILRSLGATVSFIAAWDARPSRLPGIYAAREQQSDAAEIARAAMPLFALHVNRVENLDGVIEVVPKRIRTR
jgi:hypothetical protein